MVIFLTHSIYEWHIFGFSSGQVINFLLSTRRQPLPRPASYKYRTELDRFLVCINFGAVLFIYWPAVMVNRAITPDNGGSGMWPSECVQFDVFFVRRHGLLGCGRHLLRDRGGVSWGLEEEERRSGGRLGAQKGMGGVLGMVSHGFDCWLF